MPVEEPRPVPERVHRVYWWKEALIAISFYLLYSWIRNRFERFIGLYHEESIQDLFLPYHVFIQFWNTWYGTAHFVVTLAVFVLLFWKRPAVFPVWRNSLAIMT